MTTDTEVRLRDFQVALSSKKQAPITKELTHDVISTVAVLEDLTAASMARKTFVDKRTVQKYKQGKTTPQLSTFVRMMDKLGYSIYIVKHGS